jgi:hypothetical protein
LISEYIQVDNVISVIDKKHLFLLLQLLSFLQSLDAYEKFIRDQSYFILTFRVQEFLKFIYSDTEVYNHYQFTKTIQFLKGLQTIEPLVTYFSDTWFRSVVAFPYLSVEKQAKYWNVTIAIAKEEYMIDIRREDFRDFYNSLCTNNIIISDYIPSDSQIISKEELLSLFEQLMKLKYLNIMIMMMNSIMKMKMGM